MHDMKTTAQAELALGYTRVLQESNVKNGLKVKQLVKQPATFFTQSPTKSAKLFVGLWVKKFTFSILSSLKLDFFTNVFGTT